MSDGRRGGMRSLSPHVAPRPRTRSGAPLISPVAAAKPVEDDARVVERHQLVADDFPIAMPSAAPLNEDIPLPPGGVNLEQLERSLVVQALGRSDWNQTQAARLLGLNRDQIRYRIEKFRLDRATTNTGKR